MTIPIWLLIALPLAGAAILLLSGRWSDPWGHLLGCAASLGSFAVGALLFTDMLGRAGEERAIHETLFTWVPVGELNVDFGLQLDQLSMCFVLSDHRRRLADPHLLGRLHGRRPGAP